MDGPWHLKGRDSYEFLQAEGLKIPHMGWNNILHLQNKGRLFAGVPEDAYVYFVHSYYLKAQDEKIVTATTEYGTHIHASVESGNLFACQFHPEKSCRCGLADFEKFCKTGRKEDDKMLTKRIIPCLDVNNGRVVKGVNFVNLQGCG